jgi:hypothetical protein
MPTTFDILNRYRELEKCDYSKLLVTSKTYQMMIRNQLISSAEGMPRNEAEQRADETIEWLVSLTQAPQ